MTIREIIYNAFYNALRKILKVNPEQMYKEENKLTLGEWLYTYIL